MQDFKGKVAVVTGAGSGIGRALALRCAEEGMAVAAADLKEERLTSLRDEFEKMGVEILTAAVDVCDADAMASFAAECQSRFGAPNLLFNNAGILRLGDTWSHSVDEWQVMLSVNVLGVVNGINAFLPGMLESGEPAHIVNTGSVGSLVAAPGMAQYTAAKMAVRGITECLLYDIAAQGASIGVSLLCPGPVLTNISDDLMGVESVAPSGDPSEHLMAGQPNFAKPADVAERVFDGIRADNFWIFTHPLNAYLKAKHDAIVSGVNPEYSEVTFD